MNIDSWDTDILDHATAVLHTRLRMFSIVPGTHQELVAVHDSVTSECLTASVYYTVFCAETGSGGLFQELCDGTTIHNRIVKQAHALWLVTSILTIAAVVMIKLIISEMRE